MRRGARHQQGHEPHYTFLVIDAVTGQDAVAHGADLPRDAGALGHHRHQARLRRARRRGALGARRRRPAGRLRLDGREAGDFDLFYPDRMASRILGMGDVLSLIEQAERTMDADVVAESAGRMMSGTFTLDDFMAQLNQVRKMGSLGGIMKMMPGVTKEMRSAASNVDDGRAEQGRGDHPLDDAKANGATGHPRRVAPHAHRPRVGHQRGAVNQLLKQFAEMRKMMKQMGSGAHAGDARHGPHGEHGRARQRRAQRGVPRGLRGAGRGHGRGRKSVRSGGPKNKKKKGGRVTPPKQR
jgi:signal recognition particle subunit SRP54